MLLMVLDLITLLFIAYASRHSQVEINKKFVMLPGNFWGREIALEKIDLSAAQTLNLDENIQFKPEWRTFGTGLPGYSSGRFS